MLPLPQMTLRVDGTSLGNVAWDQMHVAGGVSGKKGEKEERVGALGGRRGGVGTPSDLIALLSRPRGAGRGRGGNGCGGSGGDAIAAFCRRSISFCLCVCVFEQVCKPKGCVKREILPLYFLST